MFDVDREVDLKIFSVRGEQKIHSRSLNGLLSITMAPNVTIATLNCFPHLIKLGGSNKKVSGVNFVA